MTQRVGLLEDEDIEGLVADLKKWPNIAWGNEDERWVVAPFTTFYFLYDSSRWVDVSERMIAIHKEFERLTGYPYAVSTHPDSERPHPYGSKRGTEPSLYPVEDGIPRSLSLVNRLIKPIRDDNMDLVGFPQWDDDPNERFNDEDSRRWLSRFDETSDWPTEEMRYLTRSTVVMRPT